MRFLQVRNWERFQHYGDRRNVVWIKFYTELQGKWEWMTLPDASKGHLVGIWLLASHPTINNRIPDDPQFIAAKIGATCSLEEMAASLVLLKDPARGFLEGDGQAAAAGAAPPPPDPPAQLPLLADPEQPASNLLAPPAPPTEILEPRNQNPPRPPLPGGAPLNLRAAVDRLARLYIAADGFADRGWRRGVRGRLHGGVPEDVIAAEIEAAAVEAAAAAAEALAHQRILDQATANGSRASAVELWDMALAELEQQFDRHRFATWLRPITPRGLVSSSQGPCLILEAPNREFAAWLESWYGKAISDALKGVPVAYVVERGPPASAARWARGARP